VILCRMHAASRSHFLASISCLASESTLDLRYEVRDISRAYVCWVDAPILEGLIDESDAGWCLSCSMSSYIEFRNICIWFLLKGRYSPPTPMSTTCCRCDNQCPAQELLRLNFGRKSRKQAKYLGTKTICGSAARSKATWRWQDAHATKKSEIRIKSRLAG
jgi:hypothetical protein